MALKGDRLVYQSTQGVFCLDARTGEPIWRYDHPLEEDTAAHI